MSLGKRLRQLRLAKGFTQRDLAEPYYTHAYVSTIEAGRRRPSKEALEHFANKLGVSTEQLLTGRPPTLASELELGIREARGMVSGGKIKQARERLQDIRARAKRFKMAAFEARAVYGLGFCAERSGASAKAIDLYSEAQQMLRHETIVASVEAIAGEARCHQMSGDIRYAIHLLESALDGLHREQLEDPGSLLRLHASLVGAYFEAGLYGHADSSAQEALRLAPRVEDPERLANMYLNVAWALHHAGRAREARDVLLKAQGLFDELELRLELGRAHLARGMMLSRQGNKRKAKSELREAMSIFSEVGSSLDETRACNEVARLLRLEGRSEEAATSLERALDLNKDETYPALLGWTWRELGLCKQDSDPKGAEKHLRRAIELFDRSEESAELAITYRMLGDLLGARHDRDGACEAYRSGILALERHL